MHSQLKRWLKILFCGALIVCSIGIGFSTFIISGGNEKVSTLLTPSLKDVIPSAYFESNPDKLYTIEDALEIAGNNSTSDTIYVKPGTNPVIQRDCTISSGDKLILPYSEKEYVTYDNSASVFADADWDAVTKNRKNKVTMAKGVTLTNDGELTIGGQLGGYGAGLSGQTNGMYCEINMEPGAKIESSGQLYCFGYIKDSSYIDENSLNEGGSVRITAGTLHIPFVIHDFQGGTITVSRYQSAKVSPFEVMDVMNIQTLFEFHNPAQMKVYADLYAGDRHNTTNFNLFSSSGSLLNFSSDSYLISKYLNAGYWETRNGETRSYSSTYNQNVLDDGNLAEATKKQFKVHNVIHLYGSVSFGAMSMEIKPYGMGIGSITVSTDQFYFPVSFREEVHIHGQFSCGNKIQLMGGCYVYVEKGGTFTNSADFLIYGDDVQYTDNVTIDGTEHYIIKGYPKYFRGKGGCLYVSGIYSQTKNSFSGHAESLSPDAQLDLGFASGVFLSTQEVGYKKLESTIDKGWFILNAQSTTIENIHSTAYGTVSSDDGHTLKKGNFSAGKVYVSSDKNSQNQVYWPVEVIKFGVALIANGYVSASAFGVNTYTYPQFKAYLADDDKGTNKKEISELRQNTNIWVGGTATLDKSIKVEEGKFLMIENGKNCKSITNGYSFGQWFKISKDVIINIYAK